MKQCSRCNQSKELESFNWNKNKVTHICTDCIRLWRREYRAKNSEKIKKYAKEYGKKYLLTYVKPEASKQRSRDYAKKRRDEGHTNKEYMKKYLKWYGKTKKAKDGSKKWYLKNRERILAKQKAKRPETRAKDYVKYQINIQYKLRKSIRRRLHEAIKDNYKSGSAVNDLGCSIDELKLYLENRFTDSMNWGNWSHKGWHIDHVEPLSKFDLTDRGQFLKAVHFTNLQPLWAEDNYLKGRYKP